MSRSFMYQFRKYLDAQILGEKTPDEQRHIMNDERGSEVRRTNSTPYIGSYLTGFRSNT